MYSADQNHLKTTFQAADRARNAGDLPLAKSLLQGLVLTAPKEPDLRHALATVCSETGDLEAALRHFEKAVRLAPGVETYLSDYVQVLLTQGKAGRARKAIRSSKLAHAGQKRLLDLVRGQSTPKVQSVGKAPKQQVLAVQRLLKSGQEVAALGAVEVLIAAHPNVAMLHNLRGFAQFEVSGPEQAAESFRAALLLDPGFVEAQSNLGFALMRQGRDLDAIDVLEPIVRKNPSDLNSMLNLASVLSRVEQTEKAQLLISKVVSQRPNDLDALKIQARLHLQNQQFIAARRGLEYLQTKEKQAFELQDLLALAIDGCDGGRAAISYLEGQGDLNAAALLQHAVLLGQTGDLTGARRLLRQHLSASPEDGRAYRQLGLLQHWQSDDPAFAALRALYDKKSQSPEERAELGCAYAKALADLGQPEESIAVLGNAQNTLKSMTLYDPERTHRLFDDITAAWPDDVSAPRNSRAGLQVKPIFIVGPPRTGSTLVEQILAQHPDVHSLGEDPSVYGLARQTLQKSKHEQEGLGVEIGDRLQDLAQGHEFVTDKFLANFLYLGFLASVLPSARFCYVQRDPRDVGLSIFQNFFSPWEHPYALDMEHIAEYLIATERLMSHWRSILGDRLVFVSYEALTQAPEAEIRKLVGRLGLEWDEACLRPQDSKRRVKTLSVGQVRRSIHSQASGRWQAYAEPLKPMIDKLAEAGLI